MRRARGCAATAGGAATGEPTGVLREQAAWRFKERYLTMPAGEYVDAMRSGVKLANSRGVTCVHDKLPELRALALRSGLGSPLLRIGYLKVFMDGTLGSR